MCKVKKMNVYGRDVNVAEIKQKYINNIVEAAQKCDLIDRVILFGSSTQERCTDASDIDLAVFGEQPPSRVLTSKKYEQFVRQLYSYDSHSQAYDILYFKRGTKQNSLIMNEINKGEVLYAR